MDRKSITVGLLSLTATGLVALNLNSTPAAHADAVVNARDFQMVTTRATGGGDSLYILDNKTGQIAVFSYDTKDKLVRVRAVRPVRDAFIGR